MKIGVALSGCDIGGVCAWSVLRELEEQGFDIGMISACCVPATTSLLYSHGCEEAVMQRYSSAFLKDARESDVDYAIANLSAKYRAGSGGQIPLAINAVNVSDGAIITFTNDYSLTGENIRTFGIEDTYDVLSATISLMDGLGSYRYEDCRLCDFCCWYGSPVHPLKLAGLQKTVSIAFLPAQPKTPYEALVKHMITASVTPADLHITIEFADRDLSFEEYAEIAIDKIKSCTNQILLKTLF